MPKLIFMGEPFAGRIYELRLEKTTVGRGDHNLLVIREPSVSAGHCEILVYGPEVIVRDLGSRNGTFVEEARLHQQQSQLKSGQTVRFGFVRARLELDPPTWDDTATEETAVFALSRILRDQRREQQNEKAVDISLKLDSSSEPSSGEQTVMPTGTPPDRGKDTAVGAGEL